MTGGSQRQTDGPMNSTATPSALDVSTETGTFIHKDDSSSTSAARPAPPFFASRRVRERYEILAEHGRGGLGRVSRALDRHVAIKELLSRSQSSEKRFLREARITARLEHPGIVPIHEAGRWPDGTPFYAMKLVAGRPLRDMIAERCSVEERLGLLHHVIAVADAIAYAHDQKIIHRDLKPSNVIVGDFGETVVIDWGLAKDLSLVDDVIQANAPHDSIRHDALTNTGSVLGTPSYMAPEQERGEQVDQRADVFAIGAMLWELCALQKVPPTDARLRHRILRRASIDPDLATILDKALAADPRLRYPHAGALATDLKAFKSGARITARSYSLLAMFAHWTRRHRTLALSILSGLIIFLAGSAVYVHNIETERDRADAALTRVEATQNDLILEHADLQLRSDPTAAALTLSTYHGANKMRHAELSAEANGRGVASSVLHPHTDTIWLLAHQRDHSFISLGEDHRVQRIQGRQITNIATNASSSPHSAHNATKELLAYATFPEGMSIVDLKTSQIITNGELSPNSLAFSPDGGLLALVDMHGSWQVWQTSPSPKVIYHGQSSSMKYVDSIDGFQLLLRGKAEIAKIELLTGKEQKLQIQANVVEIMDHDIIVGLDDGSLLTLSSSLTTIAKTHVCPKSIQAIKTLPHRAWVAYGCDDGHVGFAHRGPMSTTFSTFDSFETRESMWLIVSEQAEQRIFVAGEHTVYVHNLDNKTTIRLTGQEARISAINADSSSILVGDVNGNVRVWEVPPQKSRLVAQTPEDALALRVSPDGHQLAVNGIAPTITLIRPNSSAIDLTAIQH